MSPESVPVIWLVVSDAAWRARLASVLQTDGMHVRGFDSVPAVMGTLSRTSSPDILVVDPSNAPVTTAELAEQVRDAAPQAQILLTPPCEMSSDAGGVTIPTLVQPFEGDKLSRFIRLVVAKPALRGVLQARFRTAHPRLAGEVVG